MADGSADAKLAAIEDVDIDGSGRFKYVLIKCSVGERSKFIVRGYKWAEYHGKIVHLLPLESFHNGLFGLEKAEKCNFILRGFENRNSLKRFCTSVKSSSYVPNALNSAPMVNLVSLCMLAVATLKPSSIRNFVPISEVILHHEAWSRSDSPR